jgi:aminobenzoyl-glutamate utilization protein B
MGSFTGFLAAKHVMERSGIKGRLKFFGEPAEKMCGSKPVHAAKGYYDDLDAAISFHPHSFPRLANSCFWDTHSAPYWSRIYTFECPSPETWQNSGAVTGVAHSHSAARAPGAIDAVCLMYSSSKFMKESMLPHHGSWSLNEFILHAGQAAADNIAPGLGQIQYSLRAPTLDMCARVFEVLDRNAEHCAAMTHCKTTANWITRTRAGLANHAMAGRVAQFRGDRRAAMGRGGTAFRPRDPAQPRHRADGGSLHAGDSAPDRALGRREGLSRAIAAMADQSRGR